MERDSIKLSLRRRIWGRRQEAGEKQLVEVKRSIKNYHAEKQARIDGKPKYEIEKHQEKKANQQKILKKKAKFNKKKIYNYLQDSTFQAKARLTKYVCLK